MDATTTVAMYSDYLNTLVYTITQNFPTLMGIGAGFFVLYFLLRKTRSFIR